MFITPIQNWSQLCSASGECGTKEVVCFCGPALKLAALSHSELCCFSEVSNLATDPSYRNLKPGRIDVDRGEAASQFKHPGK